MDHTRGVDFTAVYDEHVWHVYGYLGYRVRSREDAEDLTQLTFERAYRAWKRFDPDRANVKTWLLKIASNLLIDHHRRQSNHEDSVPPDEISAMAERDPSIERSLGISPELDRALSILSQRDREVIALRFGADLTGPEISELTGLSLGNVQQILSRSLRRLRSALEAERSAARAERS